MNRKSINRKKQLASISMSVPNELVPLVERMKKRYYEERDRQLLIAQSQIEQTVSRQVIQEFEGVNKNDC